MINQPGLLNIDGYILGGRDQSEISSGVMNSETKGYVCGCRNLVVSGIA
jgi:hypothetical protein